MAAAAESAVPSRWPPACEPFVEDLKDVLKADANAKTVEALSVAEYEARAAQLRSLILETAGDNACKLKLHAALGKLLPMVSLLYDYLKTTLVSSRNGEDLGGLLEEIESAIEHIGKLNNDVGKMHLGWDSKDTYTTLIADFR